MTYYLLPIPATCDLLPTTCLKPPLRPGKSEEVSIQSFGLGTKAEGRKPACVSICNPGTGERAVRLSLVRGFQKDGGCNASSVTQALWERYRGLKRFHGPVSHRGGCGSHVRQPSGALGRHLPQPGAARHSRRNPELAVIPGGKSNQRGQ